MKTKTCLILRVVQVPTGVQQVALPNWIALHQNPGFFVSGGHVCISTFSGSFDKFLSRRLDGSGEEPRTAHQRTALYDSRYLQHLLSGAESSCRDLSHRVQAGLGKVGRWTRSGELSSGSQHSAGDAGSAVVPCDGARQHWRARGACNFAAFMREHVVCGIVHAWFAGRHGEEQRAPGGRRATCTLPGAHWQTRLRECDNRETLSSLSDLASSCVPHARLFSLHPSLVSENSCGSHGVGAMNSCGFMHGVGMHDNSLAVHENSWGALGHKNSCSSHAAGVQGGTKAPSVSTRVVVRRSAVEKLASPQQTPSKLHVEVWEGLLRNRG